MLGKRLPAFDRLPAYVRKVKNAAGDPVYYWELPAWARPVKDEKTGEVTPAMRHGKAMLLTSEKLGSDIAEMRRKADVLNKALADWRAGAEGATMVPGSVEWLFQWYRKQTRFTSKKAKTRADYGKLMDMLAARETKKGAPPFGKRKAGDVDAAAADRLYEKLAADTGPRQASYAMQVCRLVWSWAARHHRVTGVKENPFMGMGLKSTAAKGNRATTRAEYNLYRAKAVELGFQSMATAAALCFEGCQRVSDAFGYVDPDEPDRASIVWEGYQPGAEITLVQSKTGNPVTLPLFEEVPSEEGGVEHVALYPELEEELARSRAAAKAITGPIVVEERNGQRYAERRMSSVHRRICEAAGLPKDMTFTGFRHGGITEIGDSGEDDVRPVSGHKTLAVTRIYNKANAEKARRIAATRRKHIAQIGALDEAREK
ncbi:hypothetical protein [Sphingomonas sp. GC_Shp_3]|uniref:hypothetical protein n=1 Tax=Sphingomonas sp. GC_Shp_3 TaxID=2937383 RepID=UPI00226AC0FF|nr:hypothetical protein [Sphingomonas sp. GC_Shp_3]